VNQRISLTSIATRLREQLAQSLGVEKIGSALDADYLRTVGDPTYWPAVWVGAQRSTPINVGTGYTGRVRQDVAVEFVVRIICKRYVAGEQDEEDRLNRIGDAVADALIGWQPSNAVKPCTWVQSVDGPPEDSVMVLDLLFQTQVTYQYPIT